MENGVPALQSASDDEIRRYLAKADPLVLRGLLYHLTGDDSLTDMAFDANGPGLFADTVPRLTDPAQIEALRKKTAQFFIDYRDGRVELPRSASPERLHKAMDLVICNHVPDEQFPLWIEELALDPMARRLEWKSKPSPSKLEEFPVAVIGAGLGGVNAAIQLKEAGFPFVVFEKNSGVGGVWFQNRYPGARVDIPSRIYSHIFAVDHIFPATFAPQAETEKYVNWCVDEFGFRDKIQFSSEVLEMRWDEPSALWHLQVKGADGQVTLHKARAVICAVGFLDRPVTPDVPGKEKFKGEIRHTTQLNKDTAIDGLRMVVVGTGSTSMQMIPLIAPQLKKLTIFQRSPAWVVPVEGYRDFLSEEMVWLDANIPFYTNWTRFAGTWMLCGSGFYDLFTLDPDWKDPDTTSAESFAVRKKLMSHLHRKLGDRPDLMAKCQPNYPPFSKRFVVDNGWYDTLKRNNVELVTGTVAEITEEGVVDQDGNLHQADMIVFATGFRANDYFWPMRIIGRDGVTPSDLWEKDGARAHLGIDMPHLPNFFAIYGPNANPRVAGPVQWGEMQTRYALKCLEAAIENGWDALEVRDEAYDRFNEKLDAALDKTIWLDPRQKSYYTNDFGRSAVMGPWSAFEYWSMTREPNLDDYLKLKAAERAKEEA